MRERDGEEKSGGETGRERERRTKKLSKRYRHMIRKVGNKGKRMFESSIHTRADYTA